ncbi:MAG: tyrosine-type recombinase/integrase [Caulobacteraceae bacterium]|nr:tyrosine-type recombinase/integrase [Caulobacteraceae bacterium]
MRSHKISTKLEVDRLARTIGRHRVDEGLYLFVNPARRKDGVDAPPVAGPQSWIFRYMRHGRARQAGLGPYPTVGLAEARARADAARRLLADGKDPLDVRAAERAEVARKAARALTFKDVAARYIADHAAAWKNPKSEGQWKGSLETYVHPFIGRTPVGQVDAAAVLEILRQPVGKAAAAFWSERTETASRIRGRIELILDYAVAHGHRDEGENPARWKGHLAHTLPAKNKVHKVVHHAAIRIDDLPGFVAELKGRSGQAARAMELVIYTAARAAEALWASWGEFDLDKMTWTLAAERMKGGREHVVPLSRQAAALIKDIERGESVLLFPGNSPIRPISHVSLQHLLARMKREGVTTHGMRAAFRTWAARQGVARDVAELSLAHAQPGLEAAYQRDRLVELRRTVMQSWCDYCTGKP